VKALVDLERPWSWASDRWYQIVASWERQDIICSAVSALWHVALNCRSRLLSKANTWPPRFYKLTHQSLFVSVCNRLTISAAVYHSLVGLPRTCEPL
jgi:hypothetical protein